MCPTQRCEKPEHPFFPQPSFKMTCIAHSGMITDLSLLQSELRRYGFKSYELGAMMKATGLVIGGGFATNILLRHAGHPVPPLPAGADIDFYVFGCLPPRVPDDTSVFGHGDITDIQFRSAGAARYYAECRVASTLRALVREQFGTYVRKAGYTWSMASEEEARTYTREASTAGDRFLTTGSSIAYIVEYFKRTLDCGTTQTLNLVFVSEPLHTVMTKVDIALTAGFIAGNCYDTWSYHHASPQDLRDLTVRWMQPEATHTERQLARMAKYCARYRVGPSYTFTAAQFLAEYDTLPEVCKITIKCKQADAADPKVMRRVRGMSHAADIVFEFSDCPCRIGSCSGGWGCAGPACGMPAAAGGAGSGAAGGAGGAAAGAETDPSMGWGVHGSGEY